MENKNGQETYSEMSPRPLGTTISEKFKDKSNCNGYSDWKNEKNNYPGEATHHIVCHKYSTAHIFGHEQNLESENCNLQSTSIIYNLLLTAYIALQFTIYNLLLNKTTYNLK